MRTWHVHLYFDSVDGIQFRTYKKMLSKKTSTISSPWDIISANSLDVLIVSFLCYNDYKAAKEVSLRFIPQNLFETINIEENTQVTVDQMMNFFSKTTHYKMISFFNNPVVNDDVRLTSFLGPPLSLRNFVFSIARILHTCLLLGTFTLEHSLKISNWCLKNPKGNL